MGYFNSRLRDGQRLRARGAGSGASNANVYLAESNGRSPTTQSGITGGGYDKAIIYRPLKICGTPDRIRVAFKMMKVYDTTSSSNLGNDIIFDEMMLTTSSGRTAVTVGGNSTFTISDGDMTKYSQWFTPADLGLVSATISESDGVCLKAIMSPQGALKYGSSSADHVDNYGGTSFAQCARFPSGSTTITNKTGHGIYTWTGTAPANMAYMPCFEIQGEYITDTGHVAIVAIGTSKAFGANDGTYVYPTWTVPYRSPYGTGYVHRGAADWMTTNAGRHFGIANYARSSSTTALFTSDTAWLESVKFAHILHIDSVNNDLVAGISLATAQANMESIIASAKAVNPNIKVTIAESLPRVTTNSDGTPLSQNYTSIDESLLYGSISSNLTPANIKAANEWYWSLKAGGTISDVVSMSAVRGKNNEEVLRTGMTEDGVHLSDAGHERQAAALRMTIYNVMSKMVAWYDTADIYNITPNLPATSTQMTDMTNKALGGSAYNMTQATSARQPLYNRLGIGDERGAFDCTAADKTMACGTALPYAEIDAIFTLKPAGTGTSRNIATGSLVSGSPNIAIHTSDRITVGKQGGSTTFGTATISDGTNYMLDVKAGSGGLKTRVNNVLDINTTNPSFTAGIDRLMGRGSSGTSSYNGQFGQCVFLQNVTDSDRDSIRASMQLLAGF